MNEMAEFPFIRWHLLAGNSLHITHSISPISSLDYDGLIKPGMTLASVDICWHELRLKTKSPISLSLLSSFRNQHLNERVIHNEVQKMNVGQKKELAQRLLKEAEMEEKGIDSKHPYQETDFENPFNTCPPAVNDKVGILPLSYNWKDVLQNDVVE